MLFDEISILKSIVPNEETIMIHDNDGDPSGSLQLPAEVENNIYVHVREFVTSLEIFAMYIFV